MPIAGKLYERQINLPNYPDDSPAIITVVSNPKGNIFGEIPEEYSGMDSTNFILSKIITKWNFTNDQGAPVEVSFDTIKTTLGEIDKLFIVKALGLTDLLSPSKKNS